jgi:hypothetical protein
MSIKYLTPRSKEEIQNYLENLTPLEKIDLGTRQNDIELVEKALSEGVDVNSGHYLARALLYENIDMVKLLVLSGYDIKKRLNLEQTLHLYKLLQLL